MILTTTNTIEGKSIVRYIGVISAEVVFGVNFVADVATDVRDLIGGRSTEYEREFRKAREQALAQLESEARQKGANGAIGIAFDFQPIGRSMLMVGVTGTAVLYDKSAEEKAQDRMVEEENTPTHFVMLDGRERGPFSKVQLRELVSSGRLVRTQTARSDGGEDKVPLAQLLT